MLPYGTGSQRANQDKGRANLADFVEIHTGIDRAAVTITGVQLTILIQCNCAAQDNYVMLGEILGLKFQV